MAWVLVAPNFSTELMTTKKNCWQQFFVVRFHSFFSGFGCKSYNLNNKPSVEPTGTVVILTSCGIIHSGNLLNCCYQIFIPCNHNKLHKMSEWKLSFQKNSMVFRHPLHANVKPKKKNKMRRMCTQSCDCLKCIWVWKKTVEVHKFVINSLLLCFDV